jgi:CRISPR/Cas system-associated exonuclease Cas4 (RecB family)
VRWAPSVRSTIGVAVHAAAEVNLAQKITTREDVPQNDMLDAFSTSFDTEAQEIETPEESLGAGKDSGALLTKLHHKEVSPVIQPVLVEHQVQYRVGDIEVSTFLDTVDEEDRVLDLKTTLRKPDFAKHLLQMTLGAVGFRQQTGRQETDVRLDVLVRNKTPKYVPLEWGGSVSDQSIKAFADTVKVVHDGIMAGRFPMNGPQSHSCSWCPYTSICPLWKGRTPPTK